MSDNSNDLGAFLAGFVIGGLVGAATALILAPQSGEETRGQIVSKSNELTESSADRFKQYREMANNYTQEYKGKAEEALETAQERVQTATNTAQEQARIVLDNGKERAAQVREQVNNYVSKNSEAGSESA